MHDRTDGALLAAAAAGEADAFAVFYRRHLPEVLRFCVRAGGSAEVGADLTAEVFATALAACGRYRGDAGSASAWLHGITRNVLRMSRRRGQVEARARRRLAMEPIPLDDGDLRAVEELLSPADPTVTPLLDGLPADQRAALQARVVQGRRYDEIAAGLRCSEAVVRQRVSRGLRHLRAALEGDHAD
jgi:RNA polymerase sigma factor (sigma-70 family)